jgi:hypothetical protein
MEVSPSWEAASDPAILEFPDDLWNLKVYYRVYELPPLLPILSQINPILYIPQLMLTQRIHQVRGFD